MFISLKILSRIAIELESQAPRLKEMAKCGMNLVAKTTVMGGAIGAATGVGLAPMVGAEAYTDSPSTASSATVAGNVVKAASKAVLNSTMIGFYVGSAPISIPITCAVKHLTEESTSTLPAP